MAATESTCFITECEKFSKIFKENINNSKNIKTEIKENLIKCFKELKLIIKSQNLIIIKQQNEINIELRGWNDRHISDIQNVSKQIVEIKEQLFSKSYSSVVKTSPLPLVENTNTKHTIIVKPNNDKTNCKQTEDIVKNIIITNNCKIGVKRVKNISKGGIAIECSSIEECDKALYMIKAKSTELSADKAALKSPKIAIYGITDDLTESEIINEIITKNQEIKTFVKDLNEEELKKNLCIKFKFRQKVKSMVNTWVLEVSPEIRKIVMKSKNLLIGWKSCSVADYISILRCFRCNGFGHKGYDSSNPCKRDVCCGHCGQSHETKRCKPTESNAFCINCDRFNKKSNKIIYNTNHSSFSSDCNCFIRIQNIVKSKTNYG
jgi:hypothetical protein